MNDPASAARQWIRQSVTAMTGGPGDPHSAVHDPLEALGALTQLRAALAQAERDAARRAREDGKSWREIGEALGRPDPDAAFLRVAERAGRYPVAPWACGDCGHMVIDRGPDAGHPEDQERGHAEGCERFAATVAAWDDADEGDGRDE
jgi:hypothetical protein